MNEESCFAALLCNNEVNDIDSWKSGISDVDNLVPGCVKQLFHITSSIFSPVTTAYPLQHGSHSLFLISYYTTTSPRSFQTFFLLDSVKLHKNLIADVIHYFHQ